MAPGSTNAAAKGPKPTESLGGTVPTHQVEGRSLLPLLLPSRAAASRDYVVSEGDYAYRDFVRARTLQPVDGCRMFMLRSERWKYLHYEGLPPQLFDMREDPMELRDLGREPGLARLREQHAGLLFDWLRKRQIHPTVTEREMQQCTANERLSGTHIGVW
jgi:arylsulfatase A-like enzyme